jgi:AcrR family transcriptional regulator
VAAAKPGPAVVGPDAAAEPARDGRAARWDDHRDQRRAELARAARRAVHHTGPDVSMEEIATAAGTSKSIVYRYFADKTALQQAVLELVVQDIEAALTLALARSAGARDGLAAMVEAYLEMIESSPHVYAFVTDAGTAVPHTRLLDQIGALLADTLAAAGDAGAMAWGAGALGFVRGAGEWWYARRDAVGMPGRAEAAQRITDWLWAGVEPAAGAPR